MTTLLQQLAGIQKATLSARIRTGEENLSTEVQAGKFRLCVFVKEGRKVASLPASDWISMSDAIARLDALQTLDDVATAMLACANVDYANAQVPPPVRRS